MASYIPDRLTKTRHSGYNDKRPTRVRDKLLVTPSSDSKPPASGSYNDAVYEVQKEHAVYYQHF